MSADTRSAAPPGTSYQPAPGRPHPAEIYYGDAGHHFHDGGCVEHGAPHPGLTCQGDRSPSTPA